MNSEMISIRLDDLRREMRAEKIDAVIFPSSDPHNSEYVAPHWQARRWISGFTGSAGTAVVTAEEAALWTDSRYFLQAVGQLAGSGFVLMKEGQPDVPSVTEWLLRKLSVGGGRVVAVDGMVMSYAEVAEMEKALRRIGVSVRTNYDAMKMIWRDRPAVPSSPIRAIAPGLAGETVSQRLRRIRDAMKSHHCESHILTDLACIAWTLNLRGNDVPMTPVFVANLIVTLDGATVFVNGQPDADALSALSLAGVEVKPYARFAEEVRRCPGKVLADSATINHTVYSIIRERAVDAASPVMAFKAVKNAAEIEGFRRSMIRDGVAMVRFLHWLSPAVEAGGQTEISVSDRLEALRREDRACHDLSFSTICGYGEHGAIVHYSASPETDAPLRPEGLLLIDSGAQYVDGTTDITRTVALGPVTDEMRRVYTYVLKAHIALATKKFPDGINGTQIDAIARSEVWQGGYGYLHGPGHGVGWCLCVHEGPHGVKLPWTPSPLHAGMTITDEPGIYLAGKFGVRTENMMLTVEAEAGGDPEMHFLRMEPLTLCPIDTTPIDRTLLTDKEKQWLNAYHERVRRELLPELADESDRQWLTEATEAI